MIFCFVDIGLRLIREEVIHSQRAAFATGTCKNLELQWKTFISFCLFFNLTFLPADVDTICNYIQFLSRSFSSVDSIRNYIHGVRVLHLLAGHNVELFKSFEINLLLKGLQRLKPHFVRRASPITPKVFKDIFPFFDFGIKLHVSAWAAFLIGFFIMARKSNLVPSSLNSFDPRKQLCRKDVLFCSTGILVLLRWSKTNQFGRRVVSIPLLRLPGSIFCPWAACRKLFDLVPGVPEDPLFLFSTSPRQTLTTYRFVKVLRVMLGKAGYNAASFTGHSFRRGGASFAFKLGIPGELIKNHGDWSSDAYLKYLDVTLESRIFTARKMGEWFKDNLGTY